MSKMSVLAEKPDEVQRRQIAGGVVEEHVLGAGVGGVDTTARGAGVPLVDGVVELEAGIGALPGGESDIVPEFRRRDLFRHLSVGAVDQRPVSVDLEGAEEGVGDADAVVGVLTRHGEVGVRVPVGVVLFDRIVLDALRRELQHPLDRTVGNALAPSRDNTVTKLGVLREIHDGVRRVLRKTRVEDLLQPSAQEARAGHDGRHLALFDGLPGDELLDVRVVEIEADHFGGATGGAARLDGTGGAVADFEKGHQPRRAAAARQRLARAAQPGEVGAGAGTILEEAGLAHPQVHDAAVVDQVVAHGLDEACVRLGVLIRAG